MGAYGYIIIPENDITVRLPYREISLTTKKKIGIEIRWIEMIEY